MPHDAKAVANVFYKLANNEGKKLTNMQLQKLVYIAHGFNLAVAGEPLFTDEVHAWEFGPVIPDLYEELKKYGAGEVKARLLTRTPPIKSDNPEMDVINAVWGSYGKFTGPQLSAMTHKEGTPWSETWKKQPYGEIRNELIAEHYRKLLDEQPETSIETVAR
ncbi:MAG TPA: type II toxin-antitoxin system antitoxin SocA domain-containing protein [Pyrinomonadaceae bacterium]|nr:type II toxin-antitoxin system antitoxin SocA domain-containing protein [Pyrinomonadaceae bacterium]